MGGIINYYHGEDGIVSDRWWQVLGDLLSFQIELSGDPHRIWARDYNTDIGIDPTIRRGDRVVYLRLDDTSGIWVRESDQRGSELSDAISRVMENRRWMERWAKHSQDVDEISKIAQGLFDETNEPLRIVVGEPTNDGPATPVSFFLSYSSRNSLLARQIYEDLSNDAKATVWFDLAQPKGTAPAHDEAIAKWLEESIYDCQGFTLLLTKSALESDWVSREIEFAMDKRDCHKDFHILILRTEDVVVPKVAQSVGKVIDCDRIWWSRGISEELFAAIYGRQGRRAWLGEQRGTLVIEGNTLGYRHLATDSGTVVSFDWTTSPCFDSDFRRKDLSWCLEYTPHGGGTSRVVGGGENKPADLDMRPGDRIAFINLRRRWGCSIEGTLPLWMRGDNLTVTPDVVLDRYYEALEINDEFVPTKIQMKRMGRDAWGRTLAPVAFQSGDGQWRNYTDLLRTMLREKVDSAELARRFLAGSQITIVDA
jgi:TIR domain